MYKDIARQAYAGLLWNKQFYYLVQKEWMAQRKKATWPHTIEERNKDWQHLYNKNIISMPDKWEFPWVRPIFL